MATLNPRQMMNTASTANAARALWVGQSAPANKNDMGINRRMFTSQSARESKERPVRVMSRNDSQASANGISRNSNGTRLPYAAKNR